MTVLPIKGWLQIFSHMRIDSILGILLHARVEGGEHLQTILVYIIRCTVFLEILVAPAIERVLLPGYGVDDILHILP